MVHIAIVVADALKTIDTISIPIINQTTRNMKNLLTMLTIVMVLYSCKRSSNELTDAERNSIQQEIKSMTNSLFESGNRKDTDQLYSNYSDKTTGIFSGVIMESWEKHKQQAPAFFARHKELEWKIENMTVDVLSQNQAVLYGKYTMAAIDTSGTIINTNPAVTYVFTKENGNWRIIHFHVSEQLK